MNTLSVIDIGTNSARLAVVRSDDSAHFETLAMHKEAIRLGEDEFAHHRITQAAMDRGLVVLKKYADISRKMGASEIVAVGTAALREAQNRAEFVDRVKEDAGVEIRMISGLEEARLIYLGVVSGVEMNSHRGLFVDIGGGTTELIVGDHSDHYFLESLKLGAIRLSDIFLRDKTGAISKKRYAKMLEYASGVGSHAFAKIREMGFDVAFGSSGTIMNLAEITAKRVDGDIVTLSNYCLNYSDLSDTISILCGLTLEQRRRVPGINPERADIIVSGAAILDSILTGTATDCIRISDRALREGVVIDHLFQEDHRKREYLSTSARERSILQLCRSCRYEEVHTMKVADLACSLFGQTRTLGLHNYDQAHGELLYYAAMLHDIGTFISYVDHHKHSYYLIRNWNLLGFNDEEIEILATAALCHRKMSPRKISSTRLSQQSRRLVEVMASILRVADALDRSQLGLVKQVILRPQRDGAMVLEVYASEDCPLEMWAFERKKALFEQVFKTDLSVRRIVA